jgi:hypothetical protein
MQNVFERSSKILVDTDKGTSNLLYLPLEKILNSQAKKTTADVTASEDSEASLLPTAPTTKAGAYNSIRPTREQTGFSYGDLGGEQ